MMLGNQSPMFLDREIFLRHLLFVVDHKGGHLEQSEKRQNLF
jgi:hypothetical protein